MIETETNQTYSDSDDDKRQSIWMRGLIMIALGIFFAIAETLLVALAVVQFLWVVITKEKNQAISDFGASLSMWIARVVKFQTFTTEERPFPWAPWPKSGE